MRELLPGIAILFISLILASLAIPSILLDRNDRREATRKAQSAAPTAAFLEKKAIIRSAPPSRKA